MENVPSVLPPIETRLAAATHQDPEAAYFARSVVLAQAGDLVGIHGTSGSFAGNESIVSDRARIQTHFNTHGLGSAYAALDKLARPQDQEMTAAEFYRYDDASSARVAALVAGAGKFALTGTEAEISQEPTGARREQLRQLWIPLYDDHGRLPAYTRFTGPTQDIRARRSSYLEQDWVLLPQLTIPALQQ